MTRPLLNVTVVCTELLALGGGKNAYGSAAAAATGCSAVDSRASAGAGVPFWTPLLTGAAGAFAFAQVASSIQESTCSRDALNVPAQWQGVDGAWVRPRHDSPSWCSMARSSKGSLCFQTIAHECLCVLSSELSPCVRK